MKVKAVKVFRDKITRVMYKPGEVLEITDNDRAADLVNRGLAEIVPEAPKTEEKPKKKPRKK